MPAKRYSTSQDTILGKVFRGLVKNTAQPTIEGARPEFDQTTVLPEGFELNAIIDDFKSNGASGSLYGKLNKEDPVVAKRLFDTFANQQAYDNAAQQVAKIQAARNAINGGNATFGDMATVGRDYLGQHKLGAMAGAGLALGNLGGLTDNDKFGGQLGGLALGGLGAHALLENGAMAHPGIATLMTLGGGQLGALFDKLRAKREQQRGQMQQMPRR